MINRLIQLITSFHILTYRWTRGRIGSSIRGTKLLLLTTTGRKSGKQRTRPTGYFMDGDNYIVSALYSSFRSGKTPAWLYNIRSTLEVTIQIRGERLSALAQQANEAERDRLWNRFVELDSQAAGYQDRATEPIPMIVLSPIKT